MAKRKPKPVSRASITMFSATITHNGVTRTVNSVDYERVEHADGTVTERGLPSGLKPGASIGEIIQHAFGNPSK